jgi:hypothetical protein
MDRRTDGQMDRWRDRQTDKLTDRWTKRQTSRHTDGDMGAPMAGQTDRLAEQQKQTNNN